MIILSHRNTLYGAVTLVPCTTTAPYKGDKWVFPLRTTIDGRAAWAICDKPTTLAVSRLEPDKSGMKNLPENEFNEILALVLDWLPKVQ